MDVGPSFAPTQELPTLSVDSIRQEDTVEEEEESAWGRFIPLHGDGKLVEVIEKELTIGRRRQCDVVIPDMRVSGVHLRIFRDEIPEGHQVAERRSVFLEDLSTNGTFVNSKKVGRGKRTLLYDGDEIVVGYAKTGERGAGLIAFIFKDLLLARKEEEAGGIHEHYDLTETLGTGNFSVVKLGIHRQTGDKVAVKIVDKTRFTLFQPRKNAIMDEVKILEHVRHSNVIGIVDVFQNERTLWLVLELVRGGDLFDRIVSVKRFEEEMARYYFKQLTSALKYLHEKGICHRDLKPENILMESKEDKTQMKISDFGVSRLTGNEYMSTCVGTPIYLPPEMHDRTSSKVHYTNAIDLWGLGCLLYCLLAGYAPFQDVEHIRAGVFHFPEIPWRDVSGEAKDLISRLLTVDPKERATIAEVDSHPWMKEEAELSEDGASKRESNADSTRSAHRKRTSRDRIDVDDNNPRTKGRFV